MTLSSTLALELKKPSKLQVIVDVNPITALMVYVAISSRIEEIKELVPIHTGTISPQNQNQLNYSLQICI